jgi:hypothetical protein
MKIKIDKISFDLISIRSIVLDFPNRMLVVDFMLGSNDLEILPQRITLDLQDLLLRKVEGAEVFGDFLMEWIKTAILRTLLSSGVKQEISQSADKQVRGS